MYLIYKYTNTVNNKVYIGQTSKTLKERAKIDGSNYRECRRFYAAIKKYSWDAFVPEILEEVDSLDKANERETYYIALYKSTNESYGYNLLPGGKNRLMSQETKDIISAKAKTRYINKTSNPMFGKRHSPETILAQSLKKKGSNNPMFGTTWSEKQRLNSGTKGKKLNLSDKQRERLSEKARQLGTTTGLRPVYCIEDDTAFPSIKLAAERYGVSKSTLCGHLTGKQKTCCNKHFKYIDLEGATTIKTSENSIGKE